MYALIRKKAKGEMELERSLKQTWDMNSIFPGGSDSPVFAEYLDKLAADIHAFRSEASTAVVPQTADEANTLPELVGALQDITARIKEGDSFIACLVAQDQSDKKAVRLNGRLKSLHAEFLSSLTLFDRLLKNINDALWSSLLSSEPYKAIAFALDERRALALLKLPAEQESLINDLAVDGYHGWGELYNTTVGRVKIAFEENGDVHQLSAGQAANKLSHPDREVRIRMFRKWEEAWAEQADYCADALNHLAGFRIQLYKHRGWSSVHKEPLMMNRMSEQTLQTMWDVISRSKAAFVAYLQRKAALFGLKQLSWHDVDAPIGNTVKHISYDDAAHSIVDQFRRFSPKMADFSVKAFEKSWIEAEDRAGKRPGGFCTSFPVSGQTRIFMTYAGTASNVSTLAHELGHAYHQHVMTGLPVLAQDYAMNVAETASTFAEMIVSDAAVKQATDNEEKLALLEDKIGRSVAFFMNIHARFIFETQFYAERQKGLVSVERLNELMESAQKSAFNDALAEYHPHFWASKLHFYLTDVPFYNFPYTFGYLFSAGIYARAAAEGAGFEDRYIALLQDTGSLTVEDLAIKHLGEDLTMPDFWQSAIDLSIGDVEQFLKLTEDKVQSKI
jgi:oligoendopeptidase F